LTDRYLDTSAALKLAVEEPESPGLAELVDRWAETGRVAISDLTVAELRRASRRLAIPPDLVTEVIAGLDVCEVTRSAFRLAGQLEGTHLRTLDALHIAVAMETGTNVLVTYDRRQQHAAGQVGLRVESPAGPS
jgi:predicted nucleic acid-binding protein